METRGDNLSNNRGCTPVSRVTAQKENSDLLGSVPNLRHSLSFPDIH